MPTSRLMVVAFILLFVPSIGYGWNYHPFLTSNTCDNFIQCFYGDVNNTALVYENSKIILVQSTQKTTYKSGEPIVVNSGLLNTGKYNITVFHWTPAIATEINAQDGKQIDLYNGDWTFEGNLLLNETLKPGITNPVNIMPTTWGLIIKQFIQ